MISSESFMTSSESSFLAADTPPIVVVVVVFVVVCVCVICGHRCGSGEGDDRQNSENGGGQSKSQTVGSIIVMVLGCIADEHFLAIEGRLSPPFPSSSHLRRPKRLLPPMTPMHHRVGANIHAGGHASIELVIAPRGGNDCAAAACDVDRRSRGDDDDGNNVRSPATRWPAVRRGGAAGGADPRWGVAAAAIADHLLRRRRRRRRVVIVVVDQRRRGAPPPRFRYPPPPIPVLHCRGEGRRATTAQNGRRETRIGARPLPKKRKTEGGWYGLRWSGGEKM